jgi:hypothetical protein
MDNIIQTKKKLKQECFRWLISTVIAFFALIVLAYATFPEVWGTDIDITPETKLGLGTSDYKIYINLHISIKNYGKITGEIASVEAFIVSKSRDVQGNPNYMRHFSEVLYANSKIPFLGDFVEPKKKLEIEANILQVNTNGFGSFTESAYEYILIARDGKGTIFSFFYEFIIDNVQVSEILGNNIQYIRLSQLHEQHRKERLEKTFESFKKQTIIGSEDNDFKSAFIIKFDPNGGIGGNDYQIIPLIPRGSQGIPLKGGEPKREGYRFLHWENEDGLIFQNDFFTTASGDDTLYAVWGKKIQ